MLNLNVKTEKEKRVGSNPLYPHHEPSEYQKYTTLLSKVLTTNELFKNCSDLQTLIDVNLFPQIITKFFSIYQMIDEYDRKTIIDLISKVCLKLKRIHILNLILVHVQFIENVERQIKYDTSIDKENSEFDYTEDINYNCQVKVNLSTIDKANYYTINLTFYNKNKIKYEYLIYSIGKVKFSNLDMPYHEYELSKYGETLSIKQKTEKILFNNYDINEKYSQIKIKKENLLFLEKDLLSRFKITKRNTTNFKKAYEELIQMIKINLQKNEDSSLICQILPFGSVTQFSHNILSDLEVTIFTNKDKIDDSNLFMETMERILLNSDNYDRIELRCTKRTTLINFRDVRYNIKIEMMLNNMFGVINSTLIRNYCLFDSRCAILINLIKDWSKMKNVNGNFNGYLSSYCYTLMVIYFLQKIQPPILPVFSDNNFNNFKDMVTPDNTHYFVNVDYEKENFRNKNKLSIAELILEFFSFYAFKFNELDYCVDISNEDFIYRFCEISYLNRLATNKKGLFVYCLIDPIDYSYNPGGYFIRNTMQEDNYRIEIKKAIENIQENKSIFV